jgi:hypothetical protein
LIHQSFSLSFRHIFANKDAIRQSPTRQRRLRKRAIDPATAGWVPRSRPVDNSIAFAAARKLR